MTFFPSSFYGENAMEPSIYIHYNTKLQFIIVSSLFCHSGIQFTGPHSVRLSQCVGVLLHDDKPKQGGIHNKDGRCIRICTRASSPSTTLGCSESSGNIAIHTLDSDHNQDLCIMHICIPLSNLVWVGACMILSTICSMYTQLSNILFMSYTLSAVSQWQGTVPLQVDLHALSRLAEEGQPDSGVRDICSSDWRLNQSLFRTPELWWPLF